MGPLAIFDSVVRVAQGTLHIFIAHLYKCMSSLSAVWFLSFVVMFSLACICKCSYVLYGQHCKQALQASSTLVDEAACGTVIDAAACNTVVDEAVCDDAECSIVAMRQHVVQWSMRQHVIQSSIRHIVEVCILWDIGVTFLKGVCAT